MRGLWGKVKNPVLYPLFLIFAPLCVCVWGGGCRQLSLCVQLTTHTDDAPPKSLTGNFNQAFFQTPISVEPAVLPSLQ